MVRVKDFLVSQSAATHMRPDKQFTLSKWLDKIEGAPRLTRGQCKNL